MKRLIPVAIAVLLALGACSKHDDAAASASASPGDVVAAGAAATASPGVDSAATSSGEATLTTAAPAAVSAPTATDTPEVTASAGSFTVKAGGNTFSMGNSSGGDLANVGVPIYPGAKPSGAMVDATENGVRSKLVTIVTSDAFADVDAWYKAHLDGSYAPTHVEAGEMEMSSYKSGDETSLPLHMIALQKAKDPQSGAPIVSISLIVKEKN